MLIYFYNTLVNMKLTERNLLFDPLELRYRSCYCKESYYIQINAWFVYHVEKGKLKLFKGNLNFSVKFSIEINRKNLIRHPRASYTYSPSQQELIYCIASYYIFRLIHGGKGKN